MASWIWLHKDFISITFIWNSSSLGMLGGKKLLQAMHASDIFNLHQSDAGNQLFSIGGSPSFRITRRVESNSNVFPSGCMGNASDEMLKARQDATDAFNYQQHQPKMPVPPSQYEQQLTRENEASSYDLRDDVDVIDENDAKTERQRAEEMMDDGNMTVRSVASEHQLPRTYKEPEEGPMYQYLGSNIARNPLTGSGMMETAAKTGKRSMAGPRGGPKWVW